MRLLVVLLLLLTACGSPNQSDVAKKLNGSWTAEDGSVTVFDFDQNRVLIDGDDLGLQIDRIEGSTVYLTGEGGAAAQVRLIGDNTAEWDSSRVEPYLLTRNP